MPNCQSCFSIFITFCSVLTLVFFLTKKKTLVFFMHYSININLVRVGKNLWFVQMIGVGTLVMMPLLGNLSDKYGRKAILMVPMSFAIIPLGTIALNFFPLFNWPQAFFHNRFFKRTTDHILNLIFCWT